MPHTLPSRRRPNFRALPAAAVLAAVGLGGGVNPARAVNYTWNSTTGTWSTPANWDNGVPASSQDTTLTFGSGTYTSTDDLVTPFTLNGITLSATAGAPTISGPTHALAFVNSSAAAAPFISVTGTSTSTFSGFTGFTLGSGITLNLNGTGTGQASFGVPFTGAGSILVNPTASSQFSLTASSTFSGGLTLSSGRLALTSASTGTVGAVTGGSLGTGTFTWNGGYARTSNSMTGARTMFNAVTIGGNIGLGDNVTIGNATQTLTFAGATTLASTQSNYTFSVSASAATVTPVNFAGAIGETTAGTGITVAAAATVPGNPATVGGTVTFGGAAANTYTGATTVGGNSATVGSVLLLNKTAGVNAVGGNVTVNNFGTVRLGASDQIPDTAVVTVTGSVVGNVNNIATFDLNGQSETIASLAGGNAASIVTNGVTGTSTLTLAGTTGATTTYNGSIQNGAGTIAVVKNGSDTAVLGGNTSNYSGGTTLNSGAIAISNVNALGSGPINLNGGFFRGTSAFVGTLNNAVNIGGDVTLGQNTPVGSVVTLAGTTTLTGTGVNRTLFIGGGFTSPTATPVIFSGAIVDGGNGNGVNVAFGTQPSAQRGILTFNGANTYTGPTNVNSGTLLINGNSSAATGAVTVANGATLGGTGTVGGATRINGILSVALTAAATPTPGLMTFSNGGVGALTLAGTSLFDVTGAGGPANRGLTYDAVNVTGALAFGGTLSVNLNGTTPAAGSVYDLFDFGSETGAFTSIALTNAGATYQTSFNYATGELTLMAVPEPSTLVSAALMLGVMGIYLRRRKVSVRVAA